MFVSCLDATPPRQFLEKERKGKKILRSAQLLLMAPSVLSYQSTPRSQLTDFILYLSLFLHVSSPTLFAKSRVSMKFVRAQRKQIATIGYRGSPAKQIIPPILLYNARNQSHDPPSIDSTHRLRKDLCDISTACRRAVPFSRGRWN